MNKTNNRHVSLSLDTIEGKFYIRTYQNGDRDNIIALFKEVFNQDKPAQLWEWEFIKNPYGTQIMLCEHEKEGIIAQCASIPAPLYVDEKIYRCAQLVDCMCKKKYRAFAVKKKGLFALTVEAFFDVFTGEGKNIYLYGFPGDRHYRLGRLLLKYRKIRPALEGIIQNVKEKKKKLLNIEDITHKIEKHTKTIHNLAYKDARIHRICILKEPDYFFWRYVNSYKKYRIFALKGIFGQIKAIFVISEQHDRLYLIDVIGIEYLKDILCCLFYEFKKQIIVGFPENSIIQIILQDINAHICPVSIPIIPVGRSFWQGLNWDFANKNFYYIMGDCDLF